MLRKSFIEYCSPTLASLKVASLFRYNYSTLKNLKTIIDHENSWLCNKGLNLYV